MAWTPEQKKAIELTGTNIIVSAGAGSGKTAVLTTRVLEKLKNGTHINELLILTFTNAAAAEMKQRIKTNIEKNNLLNELDLLDTSYITTFDSFALSIVKKYHYLLNISNKINITDSSLIALQKRKILDDIFEKNYQNPSINFQNLINTLCIKDDNNLKEEILRIANKLSIKTDLNTYLNNYLVEYYSETTINKLINDYQNILNQSVNELLLELENYQMDFETDYYIKLQETLWPLKSDDLDTLIATIKALKLPSLKRGSDEISKFAKEKINKIVTIEASGIGIACIVARHFNVPVVFAKKSKSINIEGEMYVAEVESFTHKCKNQVIVSKKFLNPEDHVLIIDDFLANGCALQGLISIVNEAGASVEGIGIVIEKGFQSGGQIIRNLGYHLESLAIVDAMDASTGKVTFREQPEWDSEQL